MGAGVEPVTGKLFHPRNQTLQTLQTPATLPLHPNPHPSNHPAMLQPPVHCISCGHPLSDLELVTHYDTCSKCMGSPLEPEPPGHHISPLALCLYSSGAFLIVAIFVIVACVLAFGHL